MRVPLPKEVLALVDGSLPERHAVSHPALCPMKKPRYLLLLLSLLLRP